MIDLSLLGGADQDTYVNALLEFVAREREERGLPHWVVIDEAHRYLCDEGIGSTLMDTPERGICAITYRPQDLCPEVARHLDALLVLPMGPGEARDAVDRISDGKANSLWPATGEATLGRALLMAPDRDAETMRLAPRTTEHVRHWHKYVEALLPSNLHFHFRTDHRTDGLSAKNLLEFHGLVRTVSAESLLFHTRRGDFSTWIRDALQDATLATRLAGIERMSGERTDIEGLRVDLVQAIEARYFQP